MSKNKVVALGELLIDFTENGTSEQGKPLLEANAAASIITTRKGALCVMPEKKEILSLIKEKRR